jgi:hypothetical protein
MNTNYTPLFSVRTGVRAGQGGGWVNGVWVPDMSGTCSGSTPPPNSPPTTPPTTPPTSSSGGWVNGVWVADQSGTCG